MAWKIAIDAMGGDKGPGPLIEGSLLAAAEFGSKIILIGDELLLTAEMKAPARADRWPQGAASEAARIPLRSGYRSGVPQNVGCRRRPPHG